MILARPKGSGDHQTSWIVVPNDADLDRWHGYDLFVASPIEEAEPRPKRMTGRELIEAIMAVAGDDAGLDLPILVEAHAGMVPRGYWQLNSVSHVETSSEDDGTNPDLRGTLHLRIVVED